MDFDRVGSIFSISPFVVYLTSLSEAVCSVYFDVCTSHLVQFITQTNKYKTYIYIYKQLPCAVIIIVDTVHSVL
jgi:hypothetical protein